MELGKTNKCETTIRFYSFSTSRLKLHLQVVKHSFKGLLMSRFCQYIKVLGHAKLTLLYFIIACFLASRYSTDVVHIHIKDHMWYHKPGIEN